MSDAVRLLYSQHRYPALSHAEAHPGTLCAAARCGGVIDPALPDDCDVLEIGCASGHHLLPLAARFPQSRFLGIDFSDTAIRQARKAAEAAGLGNIRFEHADLIEWDPAGRDFDYILAHGMLSWTADPVKAALLSLIGRCLREKGIACIGYNTLPGWSLRREAAQMTKALGKLDTQGRGLDGILETLATAAAKNATPYAHHLAAIYQDMRRKGPEILAFDDLGPCCDPLHFSQVTHWAGRNRLRYIGESQLHQNLPPGLSPEALDALEPLTDDPILFQQTLDLLSGRTHRSSLFTTAGTNLDPITTTSVTLHFEARLLVTSLPAGAAHGEILATFQAALAAAAPSTAAVTDLMEACAHRLGPRWDPAQAAKAIAAWLYQAARLGWVELRADPVKIPIFPARPALSPLNLHFARQGLGVVDAFHRTCHFPAGHQAVVAALDGSRSIDSIVAFAAGAAPDLDVRPWLAHLHSRGLLHDSAGN